jgi:hypothetical protein
MTEEELRRLRLHNQGLINPRLGEPGEVVRYLGAVQAQDYPAALWALGLRLPGSTAADIERAVAEKQMVRTWPMRGTIHFVPPEDVRWMLRMLTPRVVTGMAARHRELGLDRATFERSRAIFEREMAGGRIVKRPDMYRLLEEGGVQGAGQRFPHILGLLAQEGVLISGPHEGKQPTFVLLEDWVPPGREPSREEALAIHARRYFTSHGPATLHDFVWWTGLRVAEAREGLEMVKGELVEARVGDTSYWLAPFDALPELPVPNVRLLPVYDEYLVAYRDRSAALDPAHMEAAGKGIFTPVIMLDGKIAGTWRRTDKGRTIEIATQLFRDFSPAEKDALAQAAVEYGRFRGVSVTLQDATG